jgi:hypothetical protein
VRSEKRKAEKTRKARREVKHETREEKGKK